MRASHPCVPSSAVVGAPDVRSSLSSILASPLVYRLVAQCLCFIHSPLSLMRLVDNRTAQIGPSRLHDSAQFHSGQRKSPL